MTYVEGYLDEEELGVVRGTLVDLQGVEGTRRISELLEGVSRGLQKFVGWSVGDASGGGSSGTSTGGEIVTGVIGRCGKGGGKGGCTCSENGGKCKDSNQKYTSSYQREGSPPSDKDGDCRWDGIYQKCIESGTSGTLETLARILLGAIPFVFSGLSYLYYTFGDELMDDKKGEANDGNTRVGQYMQRMGYRIDELVGLKLGTKEKKEDNIFKKAFDNSKILGSPGSGNYAQYLEKLRTEAGKDAEQKDGQTTDKLPLLKLNILCSGYFRSLHTIDSIRSPAPRIPRTIREILYWLTSLPYCPIYRTLVPKVQEMIQRIGSGKEVIFYAKDVGGQDKQLEVSPENCANYLLGGALVAPLLLLVFQDTIECRVGKVPDEESSSGKENYKLENYDSNVSIHDLYANMQFWFSYPMSETQSYYLLQDCLVALFYQLYFLREQCGSGRISGDGWGYCKYGEGVKCDDDVKGGVNGTGCLSWICPEAVEKGQEYLKDTKKPEVLKQDKCGTSNGNKSPLQAFLCDCLKGFTCPVVMEGMSKDGKEKYQDNLKKLRNNSGQQVDIKTYTGAYPPFLDHRGHTSILGQECAVPMGFSGSFRSKEGSSGTQAAAGQGNGMIGLGIDALVFYYASDNASESGLYQITRCICSLTRRVPRSTGTLFGFFHGLGHVLFHRKNKDKIDETFKTALTSEMNCCPGICDTNKLLDALKEWRGSSHTRDNCITLDSIQNCNGNNQPNQTCGMYLQPITGALYNSMAMQFCETYVSWIIHLTGVLEAVLRKLLEEFRNINCKEAGCKGKDGGECDKQGCTPSTHGVVDKEGNKDGCCCESVVHCAGVSALLYRFGFLFNSPNMLTGKDTNIKGDGLRKCSQFYKQLEAVIGGELFDNLFKEIYRFLYTTRALFGVYIGVYWTIVLVYLLWSMTVNLDLVHIQSHWRSPRSYLVPLQRILADGSRKGFCTLGYFQENTGDRLLSLGVSDVYL